MSTISAGTTVGTALVNTGDTTGNLVLQTNGTTTAVTIGTNQVVTLAQALPIGSGGTGATTRQNAMDALAGAVTNGLYLRGDGTDVVMGTLRAADMTGTLSVSNGGTGQSTLTANHVLLGNGTSGFQAVDPGSSGNVLTSNGTTWTSSAPSGGVTSLNGQTGAITNTSLYAIGSYVVGRPQNTTSYAVNNTLAGSSLFAVPPGGRWWTATPPGPFFTPGSNSGTNITSSCPLVNVGTWRCVTPGPSYDGDSGAATLWVRIS